MYPIPPNEHLIETKTCRHCQASFPITDKDLEFYEKVSPVFPRPPLEGGMSEGQGGSVSETMNPQSTTKQADSSLTKGALKKYLIPPPTLCPDCRQQRRLSFRNERKLYKRKCDATGKDIVSIYSPDKPFKVYHQDYWWSDKWDPMDYGRDFDFGRGFFEQFRELMREAPDFSLFQVNLENSDYCNIVANSKDSYLVFASSKLEDCLFGVSLERCQDVVDAIMVKDSGDCYECFMLNNCFNLKHSTQCNDCSNSLFLSECDNCKNCLLCSNIKNKECCVWNEKVTKEEFEDKKKEILKLSHADFGHLKEEYYLWAHKIPKRSTNIIGGEFVTGDNLVNCHNVSNCFDCFEVEKGKNLVFCNFGVDHCFDCNYSGHYIHLCYEGHLSIFNSSKIVFSNQINNSTDVYYSNNCHNSSYLFGCIGLRNASYCILNKQYTKEEYEVLVPKIIEHMMKTPLSSGHPPVNGETPKPPHLWGGAEERGGGVVEGCEWGEFFPSSLSPFGYNETVAQEYYPMTREEVLGNLLEKGGAESIGRSGGLVVSENSEHQSSVTTGQPFHGGAWFNWSDYEPPFPKVEKIIPADKLPDDITKIPDDILNWAIECEVTKKPFRIIKQELEFYRKHNLPIPRRHPDQRHLDRMALRNPRKLFERKCDKCRKEIITTYAPERPEKVYCEECYNREVVG